MGKYLNPGNSGFAELLNSDYIDKTRIISLINQRINSPKKLICISRPRRFGKSYAAQMLCAYYDYTCDSHELFVDYKISKEPTYEKHINKYQVICLDLTQLMEEAGDVPIDDYIKLKVTEELKAAYPDLVIDSSFTTTLIERDTRASMISSRL